MEKDKKIFLEIYLGINTHTRDWVFLSREGFVFIFRLFKGFLGTLWKFFSIVSFNKSENLIICLHLLNILERKNWRGIRIGDFEGCNTNYFEYAQFSTFKKLRKFIYFQVFARLLKLPLISFFNFPVRL